MIKIGVQILLIMFGGFLIGWESRGNGDIVLPAAKKWGDNTGRNIALVRYFYEPQDAIDAAENGDVVMFKQATYPAEPFFIRKPLEVRKRITINFGWHQILLRERENYEFYDNVWHRPNYKIPGGVEVRP